MIEALSFLGPLGPVTPDAQSRIFYDSCACCWYLSGHDSSPHTCVAGVCQQSLIRVQHRLRLTMQHVYGHCGNLGNECADHAAALDTLELISIHNVTSRWVRRNLDTSGCFNGHLSISETLERLQHIRTNTATSRYSSLHNDTLGTIAPGVSGSYGTIAIGWEMVAQLRRFQKVGLATSYTVLRD